MTSWMGGTRLAPQPWLSPATGFAAEMGTAWLPSFKSQQGIVCPLPTPGHVPNSLPLAHPGGTCPNPYKVPHVGTNMVL